MLFSSSSSEDSDVSVPPAAKRARSFKERINFVFDEEYNDHQTRFRLREEHVELLCDAIGERLEYPTKKNCALSASQQIGIALRYMATGANFSTIADAHGVTKPTVSRALHRVVTAINDMLLPTMVKFPDPGDAMQRNAIRFREMARLPCVMGCIDGTHVDIKKPHASPEQYINRHGNSSINVMVVCDASYRFLYVSAKWPGAVNDARVFRRSTLHGLLSAGWRPHPGGYLLGDSGYPNTDFLLTPLPHAVTPQELRYNRAHKRTRVRVECALGILKQRFRCLSTCLPFEPVFSCNVIRCCVVLHNLLLTGLEDINELEGQVPDDDIAAEDDDNGGVRRQQIVQLM